MRSSLKFFPLFLCLVTAPLFAADSAKVKVLDKLDKIDPKTINAGNCKLKIISTPDPEHHKVLEVVADFAKPGVGYSFGKTFEPNTLKPKKHVAVRFWAKSNSGTTVGVRFSRKSPRKDGKIGSFWTPALKLTETWTQYTVPLSGLRRHGAKFWKDGKQVILQGGDPAEDDDIEELTSFGFWFDVNSKGTAVVAHMLVDGLELVEK
jgi:hypothetical protein